MYEVGGSGIVEDETFDDIDVTFLINFNTFFVDNIHKKVFDEYLLRNEEGYVLTKKEKVLNINIVECYKLWYDNKYQGKFEPYEEDLLLLCAAMMVKQQEEFENIIEEVRTKPEIKDLMEGVMKEMTEDERMWGRFYNKEEEEARINRAIINEERREARKEGIQENQKQTVINMYEEKIPNEVISKCTKLSIDEVNKIINDFKSEKSEI